MLEITIYALGRSTAVLVAGKRSRVGGRLACGFGWREGLLLARTMRALGYRFVLAARGRSSGRVHGPSLARVAEATGGLPGGGGIFGDA